MQTVGITVKGRVRGVFVPGKYTVEAALKCGVTGFVKNTSGGDVYIEATGTESAIQELAKWCYSGSPLSKVENVIVQDLSHQQFIGFNIRYS